MSRSAEQVQRLLALVDERQGLPPEELGTWASGALAQHPDLATAIAALSRPDAAEPLAHAGSLWALQAGDMIGPYRLLAPLGSGGMGEVWRARQTDGRVDRVVALKLLDPAWPADDLRRRLGRERDLLVRLAHPGIARLIDADVLPDGRAYLVMELIEGCDIVTYAQQARQLDVPSRIGLVLQLLDALAFAHAQGVIHRDIKPGNVWVDARGHVWLLDFGIAQLLGRAGEGPLPAMDLSGVTLRAGTPDYAAPEQREGQVAGPATDVYAVGLLLRQLLTGHRQPWAPSDDPAVPPLRPSEAVDDDAIRGMGRDPAAWRLQLKGELDDIVAKALQRDPAQRYASAQLLAQGLRAWLARPGAPPPNKLLRDQVREHLIPLNALITFAGFVLALVDFMAPVLAPAAHLLQALAVVVAAVMLLAAFKPQVVDALLVRLGIGRRLRDAGTEPFTVARWMHRRTAFTGLVLVVGLTASTSMADVGGVLASQVPSLRSLQQKLLGLGEAVKVVSQKVDRSNELLEAMAAREQARQAEMAAAPVAFGQLDLRGLGLPGRAGGDWPALLAVYLNAPQLRFDQLQLQVLSTGQAGSAVMQDLSTSLGAAAGPGAVQLSLNLPAAVQHVTACLVFPPAAGRPAQVLVHRWRAQVQAGALLLQAEAAPQLHAGDTQPCQP